MILSCNHFRDQNPEDSVCNTNLGRFDYPIDSLPDSQPSLSENRNRKRLRVCRNYCRHTNPQTDPNPTSTNLSGVSRRQRRTSTLHTHWGDSTTSLRRQSRARKPNMFGTVSSSMVMLGFASVLNVVSSYTTFSVALGSSVHGSEGANVVANVDTPSTSSLTPSTSITPIMSTLSPSVQSTRHSPTSSTTQSPTAVPTKMPVIYVPVPKGPIPQWLGMNELEELKDALKEIANGDNVTFRNRTFNVAELGSCLAPMQQYVVDLINGTNTRFAFSLFNSWGVYPDSEGNYYECTSTGNMYCSMGVNKTDNGNQGYKADVCVPSTCNETQVEIIRFLVLESGLKDMREYIFGDTTCITNDTSLAETYVIILVYVFILGIPLLASIVDAWKSNPNERHSSDEEQPKIVSQVVVAGRHSLSVNSEEALPLLAKKFSQFEEEDDECLTFGFVEIFSIIRSWRRLTANPRYGRSLRALDGIRVLSMLWIIAGQTLLIQMPYFRDNSRYIMSSLPSQPLFQILLNASLATDSFLLVSGLLAMYKILGQFSRRWAPRRWSAVVLVIMAYFRRIGRLLPLLAITMLFYVCMLPTLVNGPMWMDWMNRSEFAMCAHSWWTNILFVNNLESDAMSSCMNWTWYLGVDVQLHMLTPGIALLFWHYGISAIVATMVLILGSIGANVATVVANNLTACPTDFMDLAYPHVELETKPWTRAVPFLLGFLVAFWFNIIGEESGARNLPTMSIRRRVFLFVLSAALMFLPLFGTVSMRYTDGPLGGQCRWSESESVAYLSLYRVSWSLGLFLMILSLLGGWSGWLLNLLCMPAWTPLSRLVYPVYLLHPIVLEVLVYGGNQEPQYTPFNIVTTYLAAVCMSFFFSALVFLVLEGPLIALHDICIRGVTTSARKR
eukprot:m.87516 g.87516  ORF g.87516 m.87516 type:complete len:897 (-) comp26081_c0_seq2:85-2775(-)